MCFSMSSPNRAQASPYNPTIDHFQTKLGHNLGKPLNALHLDDFLRPLISDENHNTNIQQIIHNYYTNNPPSPSSSTSSSSPPFALVNAALSRKGFEDVWFDLLGQDRADVGAGGGETTLEEFLIRKGAINPVSEAVNAQQIQVIDPAIVPGSQQMDWLQFQMGTTVEQQQQQHQQQQHEIEVLGQNLSMQQGLLFGNSIGDIGYSENQIGISVAVPTTSIEVPSSGLDVERKRRLSDEMIEKTIERKQKRMIKNRESAARSRARKQAYTNKLEQDVSMLKEANAALENQMVLMRLPFDPNLRSKHQLKIFPFRRANSATF